MQTALLRLALVFLALCACSLPVHAAPAGNDPLVGNWNWVMDQRYTFQPDGTFTGEPGLKGTWKLEEGGAIRVYSLHFEGQKDTERVEISPGGRKSHEYNAGFVYRLNERFEIKKLK